MAFNNQPHQPRMPGTFSNVERDEYGYTEEEYVQMMDDVANAIIEGHDQVPSTPQVGRRESRPSASHDVPESGGRNRARVQEDSRATQPRVSSRGGGTISGEGGARFHPHSRYQQNVPPNAFGKIGDTYPTPPTAWHNDWDTPTHYVNHDPQPSSFRSYGGPSSSTQPAQRNSSNFSARRSQEYGFGLQTYPPLWDQSQSAHRSMPVSQPLQRSPGNGSSDWHRKPAKWAFAPQFALTSNAPSPYAASKPDSNVYSQPKPRPRYPTMATVGDEVEERGDSLEQGEKRKAGENQELTTTKMTNKSKRASKAQEDVRRGLTRVNDDDELEWLATADSEGVLAVRHDDIRPQLIAIAEAERVAHGAQYEHPDEPGPGKYNVTSFYRKHIHWGPSRDDRPEILFAWEEDKEKNPRPRCPGYMYWEDNGKRYVVLDPHDNPVKDWDLPSTIASNIPGYKLEAMRRENMSLGHKDFWARMPSRINVGTEGQPIWAELGHPNSIVNMPMERFRFLAGLCSWTERKKTSTIKAGLKKLYGTKLQNNTVRAFGRDLTTKEIIEIKKGDNARFPIKGDVVPAIPKASTKHKSKGTARPMKRNGNAKGAKAKPRERKHSIEDEKRVSSEGDALTPVRPHKRARQGRKEEDRVAAEVDDLVMFGQSPTIIGQDNGTRRYPFRATRKDPSGRRRIEEIEEVSGESSTDGEYEEDSTKRHSLGNVRNKGPSNKSSAEEEGHFISTWVEGDTDPRSESDEVNSASQKNLSGTDDEERPTSRTPFRRIPGATDVGGKSKGPSWVSPTGKEGESNEGKDYRQAVVRVSIDGRIHYATYEGLVSVGEPSTPFQSQVRRTNGASLMQSESLLPQPHPFDVMMRMPLFEQGSLEEEETPLQAYRKRVREFLGEEEAEAHAPPLKRLRAEHPVLPLSGPVTSGVTGDFPPQLIPPPTNSRQVNDSRTAPPGPHAKLSQTRERKLDAEWAQVFEQMFLGHGFQSVDYSEVPPWNDDEVQSLIDALLPTREIYFAWTGEPAPRTDPQQSYRAQFDTIFGAFQDWWREHRSNESLPILAGVMHWGRSVDDWQPPSKDSIYYEAFKKGHRAQRGDLPDWPGPRLEDAFRMAH